MKELGELISRHASQDLTHASLHFIPGENETQQFAWKIEQKAEYSRKRKRWSVEELHARFPNAIHTFEGFVADNGEMIRVFNKEGYEIKRRVWTRAKGSDRTVLNMHAADFSEYDQDGYLSRYTYLEELKMGFSATFEYMTHLDGSKELVRTIEQDITRLADMTPGKLRGRKFEINFTDVPLVR